MKDIERNDVDISKLFKWGTSMQLTTPQGDREIWVKLLGDAGINQARIYALRKSAEMRAKLLDLESDERVALVPPLDTSNKDKIVEFMLTLRIKELTDVAIEGVEITYPKDLASTASLEEQEKHQAVVDSFPKYVTGLHKKAIDKEVLKERKRLNKLAIAKLDSLYIDTMIEHLCESEMYKAFQDRSVWLACFQDENYILPLFAEFDDFLNLPTPVKNQLIDFYGTLTIEMDTLKK